MGTICVKHGVYVVSDEIRCDFAFPDHPHTIFLRACPDMAVCRAIGLWQGLNHVICDYLDRYTIADLMRVDEPGNNYVI